MSRPIIFKYFDYIEFLKDWFDFLKSDQSKFSLRVIAKNSGISSGYLPMVLSEKRKLTPKMLNRLLPHLKLTLDEEVYFELLVLLKNATNQESKMRYLRMMEQNSNYKKHNRHETEVYRYLTHWYYVAIREMTALADFNDDPEWIANKLKNKVSKQDIQTALKFLKENEFITQDEKGKYIPPEKTIKCYDGVYKLVLAQFHKEMFDLGIKSIHNTNRDLRNIKGHTFSIPFKDLEKAKDIIDKAEKELIKLGRSSDTAQVVMQGQLALFPLTEIEKDNK